MQLSAEQRRFLWLGQGVVGFAINVVHQRGDRLGDVPRRRDGSALGRVEHRRRHARHELLPARDHLPDRDAARARPGAEGRGARLRRRARRLAAPVPAPAAAARRSRSGSSASRSRAAPPSRCSRALGVTTLDFGPFLGWKALYSGRARGLRAAGHRAARARGPAGALRCRAESVLAPAGPADLDALLPMLERFNAGEGIAFDAAVARRALGELLARPELGRVYRIVAGGSDGRLRGADLRLEPRVGRPRRLHRRDLSRAAAARAGPRPHGAARADGRGARARRARAPPRGRRRQRARAGALPLRGILGQRTAPAQSPAKLSRVGCR